MHRQVAARPYAWPYDGPIQPQRTALLVAWDAANAVDGWSIAPPATRERLMRVAAVMRAAGCVLIALPPAATPILPGDGPVFDHSVERPAYGGFTGTPLEYVLRTHGRSDLVIAGFPFELGADTTMREANDLGFECLALEDASSAATAQTHAGAVSSVQMSGGIFGVTARTDELLSTFNHTKPDTEPSTTPRGTP